LIDGIKKNLKKIKKEKMLTRHLTKSNKLAKKFAFLPMNTVCRFDEDMLQL
jgi:hypothetical protein